MAKKLYEESNIQAIADAIREKNGLTETYRTADMAQAILAMDAGGSSADVIFPPTDSWEFSKVMEASDSYTMGDCRFTDDVFFGGYSGAGKGVGLRSKEKIDLTGVDFLHIEFASFHALPQKSGGGVEGNHFVEIHEADAFRHDHILIKHSPELESFNYLHIVLLNSASHTRRTMRGREPQNRTLRA